MINRSLDVSFPLEVNRTNADRPLRVVHLIEALGPGGAERLLYTNLKHLERKHVRSTVFTVFSNATHWVEPIRQLGVTVESLNCKGPRDLPAGVARLRSWLRGNRTDLIHTHLWAANIVGRIAGRLAGVPVVSSIHNPDHEPEVWTDGAEVSLKKRQLARSLDRWTARYGCQRLVAVSEYVRQSAHRHLHFPLDRIDLLYNPIDVEALEASVDHEREELLRECGLDEKSFLLLNVARVSPQKGLLFAIRAMPAILRDFPLAHLVSVGATTDPQWLKQLQTEASALGVADKVHILGARRNVAAFLRSCDLFVFPSLYEGLGIALIEAMAAGCTCVATRVGPIPEVMRHGIDGWLVNPGDSESLARGVCELLANPARREALGQTAKAAARARFQPQAAADRLMEIFRAVVSNHKTTATSSGFQI
jgi:glycosyltransferase involved in cell wall biosynthesis